MSDPEDSGDQLKPPMPDEEIAEMVKRCEAATPGPWRADEPRAYAGVKWDNIIRSARANDPICTAFFAGYMEREAKANSDFIAHARSDVPALARELQAAREAMRAVETVLMIVEPRSHKAEYLIALAKVRSLLPKQGSDTP